MPKIYAEEMNYFQTTVHPAKSQGEIVALLEEFGVENIIFTQGLSAGRIVAWIVRFEWDGRTYRFGFKPLECLNPDKDKSYGGRRRANKMQAKWQMGRIAVHFTKAILTAATVSSHALFGYVELPEAGTYKDGSPIIAGELGIDGLTGALPNLLEAGDES